MEEMIRKAIDEKLPYVCFTDHIDYDYPVEDMIFDFDKDAYFSDLTYFRDKYRGKIGILSGVELGMKPDLGDRYTDLIKKYPFDFVIGSEHLVHNMDPWYPETFEGRNDADMYRDYFSELLENIRLFHGFDALGHLDYIVRYGKTRAASYRYRNFADVIDPILKLLVKENIALEVNTAGLRKRLGFPNPHPDVLRRYRELGGTLVTVGSDSHKSYSVGFGFEQAAEMIRQCGFTHVCYYEGRKPRFVKL